MDYAFTTAPVDFDAALSDAEIPEPVKEAIRAVWAVNDHSAPSYEISAATGETWTVVRVAQVDQAS